MRVSLSAASRLWGRCKLALDFRNVIMLSGWERSIFPFAQPEGASYIPYNLRLGFGLPTYGQQDAMWAYYFYRCICRAKENMAAIRLHVPRVCRAAKKAVSSSSFATCTKFRQGEGCYLFTCEFVHRQLDVPRCKGQRVIQKPGGHFYRGGIQGPFLGHFAEYIHRLPFTFLLRIC